MRLACSNIAWSADEEPECLAFLRSQGVTGIEVAPTRLWPGWHGATSAAAAEQARRWSDQGWAVSSMQALLFDQPQAQLFGADDGRRFEQHLTRVAALGQALGASVAVLGAPRNRCKGPLSDEAARAIAVPRLHRLAEVFDGAGMRLALEPARPEYGGDFVTTTREAIDLAREVGHRGLAVHLDAAALASAGESVAEVWSCADPDEFAHYQLSEPALAGFEQPLPTQASNLRFLVRQGWTGWCAVEMRRPVDGLARSGPWAIWHSVFG